MSPDNGFAGDGIASVAVVTDTDVSDDRDVDRRTGELRSDIGRNSNSTAAAQRRNGAPTRWPKAWRFYWCCRSCSGLIGFARQVLVCRWLEPIAIGRMGYRIEISDAGRAAFGAGLAWFVRPVYRVLPLPRASADAAAAHRGCLHRFELLRR